MSWRTRNRNARWLEHTFIISGDAFTNASFPNLERPTRWVANAGYWITVETISALAFVVVPDFGELRAIWDALTLLVVIKLSVCTIGNTFSILMDKAKITNALLVSCVVITSLATNSANSLYSIVSVFTLTRWINILLIQSTSRNTLSYHRIPHPFLSTCAFTKLAIIYHCLGTIWTHSIDLLLPIFTNTTEWTIVFIWTTSNSACSLRLHIFSSFWAFQTFFAEQKEAMLTKASSIFIDRIFITNGGTLGFEVVVKGARRTLSTLLMNDIIVLLTKTLSIEEQFTL